MPGGLLGVEVCPIVNEFVDLPVPRDQATSGWRIALIKIGIVIALPGFLTGAELGSRLGLVDSSIAIVCGCLLLAGLCALTGSVAARSRLPTAIITQFAFGRYGAMLVNLVLAITLIGWFSVTVELFANSIQSVLGAGQSEQWRYFAWIAMGGLLMVLTTVFGFSALTRLSNLAVPLLLTVLVAMAWYTAKSTRFDDLLSAPDGVLPLGVAISAVVGGPAAGTVIFPDLARFARSVNHGRAAAVISYGVGMPLVLLLVAVTAIATGEKDLVLILSSLGFGVAAVAFLILAAWTTNVGNLYSGSIFLSAIVTGLQHRSIVLIGGGAGVIVAWFGLTDHFIQFLVALGIAVPPIAGIYVIDYFLRGGDYDVEKLKGTVAVRVPALAGWVVGVGAAYWSAGGKIVLTGIPACDSIVVSALVFGLLARGPRLLKGGSRDARISRSDLDG